MRSQRAFERFITSVSATAEEGFQFVDSSECM